MARLRSLSELPLSLLIPAIYFECVCAMNDGGRTQLTVCGTKKRTSVTSLSLSCLSMLASSVFFYPPFLSLSLSPLAFELDRCARIPLCSITPLPCSCVCARAPCYAALAYTSSSSITTIVIHASQNVFVHMQRHASEERARKS